MHTYDSLKAREQKLLMQTYGRYPLAIQKAEGSRLTDFEGREYVDLLAGIAVANLGHGRPELAEAMAEQALKLVHVSNLFYQEEQLDLAEKLLATCLADRVFFCNSGAEANEGAIKLARRYTQIVKKKKAYEILTLQGSFHGRTLATVAATGQGGRLVEGFDPLPAGFTTVPFGDAKALEASVSEITCAVMIEMVQGEGGVRPLSQDYLEAIKDICHHYGLLLIVDEIQTGLGRTGRFWAHEHYGLKPDIFTSAKGLANGLPMGAILATEEVSRGFEPGCHATTFGGGGVLSVVASRTIDILLDEKLSERAERVGSLARARFRGIMAAHPTKVAEVRGLGLMIGIELTSPGKKVWEALLHKGFILNLTQERVLRLLPPLTIAEEDIEAFACILDEVLTSWNA
ncbi:MAG: aspartate aminotransferase family protein [Proteobacteria bacterium]|nr:aspartate aminotransferase family protein [Pseudomonadota bacterium]MBU1612493.1 aspartate aminotransferase family protein [Pseudomonadota bacterium]